MKGNPEVIKGLMDLLADERAAQVQYKVHAGLVKYYGYLDLLKTIEHRYEEENKHEQMLIARIIFLGGRPEDTVGPIELGEKVVSGLALDAKSEQGAIAKYNKYVKISEDNGDYGTADLLIQILKDEEEHLLLIEKELLQVAQVGEENFLSEKITVPALD